MLWKDKIKLWKAGVYQSYPKKMYERFFFETSPCDKDFSNTYEEVFIENNKLKSIMQDYRSFNEYIIKSKNKYVTSFYNLSGDSLLIIPIPKNNKDFTTIKDFCDNASITHQIQFWRKVAVELEHLLKSNENIYVSTHGLGEYYFHLRLDKIPKYYKTKKFIL
jgi:hypothetical protein